MKEKPRAQWEHKTRFPIQDRMSEVIKTTITASEKQLEAYRKKLRKMQFGS